MTSRRFLGLCSLLLILGSQSAFGQEEPEEPEEPESEVSPQIWIDYNPSVMLNPKLNRKTPETAFQFPALIRKKPRNWASLRCLGAGGSTRFARIPRWSYWGSRRSS